MTSCAAPRPSLRRSRPADAGTTPAQSRLRVSLPAFAHLNRKTGHRFPLRGPAPLDTDRLRRRVGAHAPHRFARTTFLERERFVRHFFRAPTFAAGHGLEQLAANPAALRAVENELALAARFEPELLN